MRVKTNILVVLLTFLLGVTISRIWYGSTTVDPSKLTTRNTSVEKLAPVQVTICDLLNDPGHYRNKLLKLEGVLYSTDTALLVYDSCSNANQVPVIAIGFQDLDDNLSRLIDNLDGGRHLRRMEADVRVIGEIEHYSLDDDPYLHIVVEGFEVLSPLRRFKLRGAA